jgi:hypothetical protein
VCAGHRQARENCIQVDVTAADSRDCCFWRFVCSPVTKPKLTRISLRLFTSLVVGLSKMTTSSTYMEILNLAVRPFKGLRSPLWQTTATCFVIHARGCSPCLFNMKPSVLWSTASHQLQFCTSDSSQMSQMIQKLGVKYTWRPEDRQSTENSLVVFPYYSKTPKCMLFGLKKTPGMKLGRWGWMLKHQSVSSLVLNSNVHYVSEWVDTSK